MKKDLIKKLSFFILATGLQAIINYTLISFFANNLDIESFGKYNIYLALLPILLIFTVFGLDGAVNLYYHKFTIRKYKILLFNIFFVLLPSISLLFFLISIPILKFVSHLFKINFYTTIIITGISIFQSFILSYLSFLQTKGEAYKYLKIFSSHILISNSVGIFLFILLKSLDFFFIGILVVNFLYVIYILFFLWKKHLIIPSFNLNIATDMTKYGISLLPNAIGSYLFFMSDRYFVSYFYGNKEVAFYSVGLYISMIIIMFNHALVKAWNPMLFKELKLLNNDTKRKIVKISYLIIFAYIFIYILILLFDNFIFSIMFPEKFSKGLEYVPWIALGYIFIGFFKVFSGYLFYLEKNKLISFISILSAIINIVLNYIFINMYGPLGVAYATAITMFIFMLFVFIYVQKYFKLPWIEIVWEKINIMKK